MAKNDLNLMYGLDKLSFEGKDLGYIEEDSFDWGGAKGEVTDIRAAQKKGYPVAKIPKSNGTVNPTFDLIQFNYENMAEIMGGEVKTDNESKPIGWGAPSNIVMCSGKFTIDTDSGQRITIPNALLSVYITGNLNLTSVSKLKCELGIMEPADGGEPFSIEDITE
ncbi:hypothetical protein [Parabacteroides sp. PF5-9]|uniref:hypothetical protein n=1 Tax=Parabacteroides sp. PF5-9 TaxID=1742404 RepID=UPI0024762B1D|nr:hypothetical protein [Parabacteroides sp. PF5-9]MDH6357241.1 hypothetical protein [Parabacteroides sp. PF5-9]